MNTITGSIASTYFVNEVTTCRTIRDEKKIITGEREQLGHLQHVCKVKELKAISKEGEKQEKEMAFRTELITNEDGKHSVICLFGKGRFIEIGLEGQKLMNHQSVRNPFKAKEAYFLK